MVEQCWIVRAVEPTEGYNALGLETTLIPGMRGWVPCAQAVALALAGKAIMLSPGGIDELRKTSPLRQTGAVTMNDAGHVAPKPRPKKTPSA